MCASRLLLQFILDSVIPMLNANPERAFIYVEQVCDTFGLSCVRLLWLWECRGLSTSMLPLAVTTLPTVPVGQCCRGVDRRSSSAGGVSRMMR